MLNEKKKWIFESVSEMIEKRLKKIKFILWLGLFFTYSFSQLAPNLHRANALNPVNTS